MTTKFYEIKSKKFKAVQWLGNNREEVSKFAPYLINYAGDNLYLICGSCAGRVSVGDWIVMSAGSLPSTNILKYDGVDFESEYEVSEDE